MTHKQKAIYCLTEKGIATLRMLAQVGVWGRAHAQVTKASGALAAQLERGGPRL